MKRLMIGLGVVVLVLVAFFAGDFGGDDFVDEEAETPVTVPVSAPSDPKGVNFQTYNIDYMNDGVKAVLVKQLGASGRTAFYLPSVGYVNVSRGAKYGVAFAIQNVNPNVPDGNRFAYNFDASFEDCGVGLDVAQGWIERGWASSGMIAGQWREDWNEWYDAMTIYFAFPEGVGDCSVGYDFVITRDGVAYDSRSLLFNLV